MKCGNGEKRSKCRWVGTLGTLHNHLAECKFSLISCPKKCKDANDEVKSVMRKELNKHLAHCPNRDFECTHCGEKGTFTTIKQVHDEVCQKKILPCVNFECKKTMQRQHVYEHVKSECEYSVTACRYKSIGCDVHLQRKDIAAHEQDDSHHLHMAIDAITQVKEECDMLKNQNSSLKEECAVLKSELFLTNKSITFQITDYQTKKETNSLSYSPSFYSGPGGYHFQVIVNSNGFGGAKGTHMSVYAYVLVGNNDAQLKWPFVGTVRVTLLNQEENMHHFCKVIIFTSKCNAKTGTNRGISKYISHSELQSKPYLKDDTLFFKVTAEAAGHKPWLKN